MIQQILKFIIIGGISTAINYGIFWVLYDVYHIYYMLSSAVGFISGMLFGYWCNRIWTFRVTQKSIKILIKYCIVYVFSLLLSILLLNIAVETLYITPKIAQLCVIFISTCTNFLGIKFFAFKK